MEAAGFLATTDFLFLFIFSSFLKGPWKPKEVAGGRRTAHSQCPPEVAGEVWSGGSVFLVLELVKHMVQSACSGVIDNGRIWTSVWGPKEPPASWELTVIRLDGTEECS